NGEFRRPHKNQFHSSSCAFLFPKQYRARQQAGDLRRLPLADTRGTASISARSLGVGDKPSQSAKKSGRKIEQKAHPSGL
ncbi:hypothetical protein L0337_41195, partial [candidate division KSB1 bacterium]|nr:hypothetical protein [candidate division KSB1 bacterium]